MGAADAAVWRVVDIRFVFPDEERAAAYHAERLQANSEGNPVVPDAPAVGQDCGVFGGTSHHELAGARIEMTMYFYVFRLANVVVKLFVAQGPKAPRDALTPARVVALAEPITTRIERARQRPHGT
jgi:hypothetical protein